MTNRTLYISFFLFCLLTAQSLFAQDRGLQPEDYYNFKFISSPQISPDGSDIIFVKSEVSDDKRTRESSLWMVKNEDGAEPRKFTSGTRDRSPKWSPDGKQIAFIANRNDETKIWVIPKDGGEARPIFESEHNISDFDWSLDGSRLLLTMSKESEDLAIETEADIRVVNTSLYKANGVGILPPRRTHLWVYNIADEHLQPLTWSTEWNAHSASFSPDGNSILFAANMVGDEYEGGYNQDLFVIPADSGEVQKLTQTAARSSSPVWSNDGSRIAFTQTEERYQPTYIYTLDIETGEKTNLNPSLDFTVSNLQWSADDSRLLFESPFQGKNLPVFMNLENGNTEITADGNYSIRNIHKSNNGRFTFLKDDEITLAEVWASDSRWDTMSARTQLNKPMLDTLSLNHLESFWFENEIDRSSQGFLLKPIGWEEGTSYPLVLNIKGGPGGMWGHQWFHEFQMMAARGYAVFFTNYRGSHGYGFAHREEVFQDYGGADYRDNIAGLEYVLEQNDWIDQDRLFITGGSHGGFLTNWITAQNPDLFKAAVTQRSVSNWISEAGTQSYVPQSMREEFGGTLWENYDLYWGRSPLKYADQVQAPTLIIHSDGDEITPIGQAEEWYYALKINNVPVEMVVFEGENHSLSRTGTPVNLVERLNRIINWFEKHN